MYDKISMDYIDALNHNFHPKYLGKTLDRTKLSFKTHLENTTAKLSDRNYIIKKLCGTFWGALKRNLWCTLINRIRTSHGKCVGSLHILGMTFLIRYEKLAWMWMRSGEAEYIPHSFWMPYPRPSRTQNRPSHNPS